MKEFRDRTKFVRTISFSFSVHPVVALLGPRQCGKTTLARTFVELSKGETPVHYFDLEDPEDLRQLENPKLVLEPLEGLIVIDEIQRLPDLFPLIRVLVDQPNVKRRFLILGSASRDLIQQSSETLAGRISHIELPPFSFGEVRDLEKLWIRGGFPKSYLAESVEQSVAWRKEYVATFLERDVPQLGFNIPPQSLRRFWMMLAHCHGSLLNASEIGRSLGVSGPTVRRYLDILTATFMIRQLQPWSQNIGKRQVKSPKIYFRDSGLFHSLLGTTEKNLILKHPMLGASWEGFALEAVIRGLNIDANDAFFWAVHQQAELDLLIFKEGRKHGYEFKWRDAPRLTRSMVTAMETLELESCTVIYPGKKAYPLAEGVRVVGLKQFLEEHLLRLDDSSA
jgi:predicted AAA+ superfamily ATPase